MSLAGIGPPERVRFKKNDSLFIFQKIWEGWLGAKKSTIKKNPTIFNQPNNISIFKVRNVFTSNNQLIEELGEKTTFEQRIQFMLQLNVSL